MASIPGASATTSGASQVRDQTMYDISVRGGQPNLLAARLMSFGFDVLESRQGAVLHVLGSTATRTRLAAVSGVHVIGSVRAAPAGPTRPLLYLAGADISRDLAGELGARGIDVTTRTTYRMVPIARLPGDVREAFSANRIQAILHYSTRSARAFLDAARAGGVEISALAILQCCISAAVAEVLREAGAVRVAIAASPNEDALLTVLSRSI